MGQYYKAILLDADKKTPRFHFSSWGFNNGAKLTEHSFIGNTFMGAVEKVIADNPMPLVWGGDYADIEEGKGGNLYDLSETMGSEEITPTTLNKKLHIKIEKLLNKLADFSEHKNRYILNHSKKEYVDKEKCPYWLMGEYKMALHPLSLLTAEGNERGGGDYEGTNMRLVGRWSRDTISVSNDVPDDFVEIIPNFVESYYKKTTIVPYPIMAMAL